MSLFKLGESVSWTSSGAGVTKTKTGEIVQVVPVGERPDRDRFLQLYTGPGVGAPRREVSYVVKVGTKFYWPRTSALVLAKKAAPSGKSKAKGLGLSMLTGAEAGRILEPEAAEHLPEVLFTVKKPNPENPNHQVKTERIIATAIKRAWAEMGRRGAANVSMNDLYRAAMGTK